MQLNNQTMCFLLFNICATTSRHFWSDHIVMKMFGKLVDQTEGARKVLQSSIGEFFGGFKSSRKHLLNSEEKDALIAGATNLRADWIREDSSMLGDIVANGYQGFKNRSDEAIIENTLVENRTIHKMNTDEERVVIARLLARQDILNELAGVEGFDIEQMLIDLDEAIDQISDDNLRTVAGGLYDTTMALLAEPNDAAPAAPML